MCMVVSRVFLMIFSHWGGGQMAKNCMQTKEFWKIAENCMKTKEFGAFHGGILVSTRGFWIPWGGFWIFPAYGGDPPPTHHAQKMLFGVGFVCVYLVCL